MQTQAAAGQYRHRDVTANRPQNARSGADPHVQHYYGQPHRRSRDSRDDDARPVPNDEPVDSRHHRQQQQQQQQPKNSPVRREKSDHRRANGDVSRDNHLRPGVEMSGGKNSPVPAATYELEHLATFAVSQSPGQVKPAEALERLREMESTSGVWAMKVILRVDCADINVIEQATLKEIECFPVSRVGKPTSVADADTSRLYSNVVIFTVHSDAANRQSAEMHLFQAATKQQCQDLIDDINAAISGRFPRLPPTRSAVQPAVTRSEHSSPRSSDAGSAPAARSRDDQQLQQQPAVRSSAAVADLSTPAANSSPLQRAHRHHSNAKQLTGKDDICDEILLLNHCFDDIERFVASLQQAANAQKELDRRRLMTAGGHDPAEDTLRKRAQQPPAKEFIDTLQKFKLAFNLLPKLKRMLKDPDALQLLHMLFSPLAVVIDACRDDQGQPGIATKLDTPLLTAEACYMLDGCLHPREAELWKSLGRAWTTPSNRWSGVVPTFYPQFSDGWKYQGASMEDIGLSVTSVARTRNSQQFNSGVVSSAEGSSANSNIPNGGRAAQQRSRPAPAYVSANVTQQQQQQQQPVSASSSSPASQPAQVSVSVDASQQQFLQQLQARGARIYLAIISRDSKNQKELSVRAGDVIEVIDSSKNWWKVRNHTEAVGFVPNTILKPFPE